MRYPQLFASKAIKKKLDDGVKNGIIWHTQGSGKTALAFYNVRYLSNYFQKKGQIAKFYFKVDRLDLLKQASGEFRNRGLSFTILIPEMLSLMILEVMLLSTTVVVHQKLQ